MDIHSASYCDSWVDTMFLDYDVRVRLFDPDIRLFYMGFNSLCNSISAMCKVLNISRSLIYYQRKNKRENKEYGIELLKKSAEQGYEEAIKKLKEINNI